MNRTHLWKLLLIVFVTAWAVYEMSPPTDQPVVDVFQREARNRDKTLESIVARAQELNKQAPQRAFLNLREAVGTNDITRYFPQFPAKEQKDPNSYVLNRVQRAAAGQIRLGLDLRGGTSFLVAMDTNQLTRAEEKHTALANAVEVLRKRVDKLGVAEPQIQPQGLNRILIQLPGLSESDKETARRQIERAAFLEFRMVHPNSDELLSQGIIEPGYEILTTEVRGEKGEKSLARYLVNKKAERNLTGKHIKRAFVDRHPVTTEPLISFELDSEGAKLFADITREYAPKNNRFHQLAIVLDGELYSAPRIQEPIEGGRGQITGNFDLKEAFNLATALENPLEAPVTVIYEQSIDPSLGADSIRSGVKATIYGVLAVAVFMMFFYFFAGFVADFALMLNVVITMGVMCSIDATLTLPGIAGLVLSIGMAVDANVLIFERIREEFAAGKGLRGALHAGYSRAFGTIFDSHITTLISAVILMYLGTGPIKGFGVMLTIGVAASLFTALVVTRLVFDFLIAKGWMKNVRMMPIMRLTKVDFLRFAKPAMAVSLLIILGGLAYGVFGRGEKMLGVDFAGGDSLTLSFNQKVDVDKLRDTVAKLNIGEPTIQYQKPLSGGRETLQVLTRYNTETRVEQALKQTFPEAGFQKVGTDKVGPTVGQEIRDSAIIALLLATLGILFYVAVRYEFSFAVAAVIATAHDALITMAIFALVGGELSAPIVAAILTVIGYSINDKIVILDRIREDLKLGVRGSFRDLINLALNQTLSRTLITGGSVMLATLSLLIFGGGVIKDFSFTFLVGILAGTYSSIYIAAPIVLWWHKGERPRFASSAVTMDSPTPQGQPVRA